jgi:hypothetical protein
MLLLSMAIANGCERGLIMLSRSKSAAIKGSRKCRKVVMRTLATCGRKSSHTHNPEIKMTEVNAPHGGMDDSLYNLKLTPNIDFGSPGPTVPVCPGSVYFNAAIDRLPNEILELIFIFYLELDGPANRYYFYYTKEQLGLPSQCLLAAVSTRWRAVIQSAPQLWSHIGFDFNAFRRLDEKERNCYARRVDMFLRHSKDCPLNVSILVYMTDHQAVYEQGLNVIESLFTQCSRWRSAALQLGKDMSRPWTTRPPRKLSIHWPISCPQLESLSITDCAWPAISSIFAEHDSDIFLTMPNLKHLYINRTFSFKDLQHLRFPFSRIRTLELPEDWTPQEVLRTLQAATVSQLDHLRFTLKRDHSTILVPPMNVFCEELVLAIHNQSRTAKYSLPSDPSLEISQFFERVQFVGTKSVTLGSYEPGWTTAEDPYETRWTAAQIQGFLHSMQPSMSDLTCLSLGSFVFSEKDLISLLPHLLSLQTLRIIESIYENDAYPVAREAFFHALTVTQANFSSENVDGIALDVAPTVIIPQLRELELYIGSRNFASMDLLVDMVRSRPQLGMLKVVWVAHEPRDGMQPMQEMVEDLKLRLSRPEFRIQESTSDLCRMCAICLEL